MIWLRDGARSIRIEPRDILWITSAGNYIEYSLADGTNHLIRGTLAAAESELTRFNLVRIHRTRLANLDRVSRRAGQTVRRFRPDLRHRPDALPAAGATGPRSPRWIAAMLRPN